MSEEQTPPGAGAPLPPGAQLPPGPPAATPVYRQDEFVRRATPWTRPMQLAVALYFVVTSVLQLVLQFVLRDEYRSLAAKQVAKAFQNAGRAYSQKDVDDAVTLGLTVALIVTIVVLFVLLVLAVLTAGTPRTWVFWVDLVVLALSAVGLVGAIAGLANPSGSTNPQAINAISLVTGVVSLALAVWMIVGLVRYGPWAQEKVSATL